MCYNHDLVVSLCAPINSFTWHMIPIWLWTLEVSESPQFQIGICCYTTNFWLKVTSQCRLAFNIDFKKWRMFSENEKHLDNNEFLSFYRCRSKLNCGGTNLRHCCESLRPVAGDMDSQFDEITRRIKKQVI